MKTKLFALLTALSLVSAPAFAEIDLTPYELPSEYGSSVQVISPALTLVLTDKSYGRNNENTLPTSITLYDEGKIGLQIELPDYAADGICRFDGSDCRLLSFFPDGRCHQRFAC